MNRETENVSSVLVVGSAAAGVTTADALRRKGFDGDLTVLGAETHPPYDRPPLSKQVLSGQWEADGMLGPDKVLPADVVVVAIGADPATDWLEGSGLKAERGLVCDSRCRAAEGIYAVGDVARWEHPEFGLIRLENRTNAGEQAMAVADTILGGDRAYRPVPYFWTDQFDAKIHVHGVLSPDDEVTVVEGDRAERRFVELHHRDGRLVGVLGWNLPKQTRQHRKALVESLAR